MFFPVPRFSYSQLPIPWSLSGGRRIAAPTYRSSRLPGSPNPYSLLPIPYSLVPLLPNAYCLLPTASLPCSLATDSISFNRFSWLTRVAPGS